LHIDSVTINQYFLLAFSSHVKHSVITIIIGKCRQNLLRTIGLVLQYYYYYSIDYRYSSMFLLMKPHVVLKIESNNTCAEVVVDKRTESVGRHWILLLLEKKKAEKYVL